MKQSYFCMTCAFDYVSNCLKLRNSLHHAAQSFLDSNIMNFCSDSTYQGIINALYPATRWILAVIEFEPSAQSSMAGRC